MSALPFQTLPLHIVQIIVSYVVDNICISYDSANTTPKPGTYSELQIPLLWVCHKFRAFVLKRFCYSYRLFLSDYPDQSVAVFESWPQCLKMDDHAANHSVNHQAKDLTIHLEVSDVYSGKALRRLSASPYTGCGFPLVRKLTYYLNVGDTRMAKDSSEAKDNVTAFVQRIKEVAPVSEVSMEIFDPAKGLAHSRDTLFTDLAKGLFGIVETTVITHCSESLVEYMDLNLVCNLVRLVCDINDDSSPVIPLIRRNAPTLQSLVIAWDDTVDLAGLIRNPDDDAYLEYPCLHTLKLHSYYEVDVSQRPTLEGAAPFPYLRYLRIDGVSPFGDDVLFRGNSTVLEYLRLELNLDTVTTLKQYSVFTPTSHPKLQRVTLDQPSDDLPAAFIDANAYMQLALGIAPNASVRVMPSMTPFAAEIPFDLLLLGNHASIQIPSMPDLRLCIWAALALIKSLPLLSDMHTLGLQVSYYPEGVCKAKLPDYVRSTYAPIICSPLLLLKHTFSFSLFLMESYLLIY